jgi:hypothetical protein
MCPTFFYLKIFLNCKINFNNIKKTLHIDRSTLSRPEMLLDVSTGTFAAPGLVYTTSGRIKNTGACAASGLVYTTEGCAAPGRVFTLGA